MKLIILAISMVFATTVFAATKTVTTKKTTKIAPTYTASADAMSAARKPASTTAGASSGKSIFSSNEVVGSANENVHFMTNLVGLFDGKTNIQGNFFARPQIALTVNYNQFAEKTSALNKNTAPNAKIAVTTTQYGVGGAYYVWPVSHRFNAVVNPYLLSEQRRDVIDVDNSIGFGLKADGMMRLMTNFTMNIGAQYTNGNGNSNTFANAAVGYLF